MYFWEAVKYYYYIQDLATYVRITNQYTYNNINVVEMRNRLVHDWVKYPTLEEAVTTIINVENCKLLIKKIPKELNFWVDIFGKSDTEVINYLKFLYLLELLKEHLYSDTSTHEKFKYIIQKQNNWAAFVNLYKNTYGYDHFAPTIVKDIEKKLKLIMTPPGITNFRQILSGIYDAIKHNTVYVLSKVENVKKIIGIWKDILNVPLLFTQKGMIYDTNINIFKSSLSYLRDIYKVKLINMSIDYANDSKLINEIIEQNLGVSLNQLENLFRDVLDLTNLKKQYQIYTRYRVIYCLDNSMFIESDDKMIIMKRLTDFVEHNIIPMNPYEIKFKINKSIE